MTKRAFWAAAAAAAVALGGAGEATGATCQFAKLVEVPVEMQGLRATVPVAINGHDTRLFIDTGAFFSVVSDEAAQRFGMRKSGTPFGLQVKGMGGTTRNAEAVMADNFTFAGAGFKNIQFLVGGRIGGGELSGVIGQNIMGPFDVEYDFANGVMRFFKATGCGGNANLAYWSKGMALSRLDIEDQGRFVQSVLVKAQVNGHTIRVKMDSGSGLSVLNRRAAGAVGVEIDNAAVTAAGVSYGAYGGGIETFLAPFASFKIGDEEIRNTKLRIADIRLGEEQGEMLLGADFFLSHRILISNSQKKVYFTYNGGPVFRLDRNAGQVQTQAAEARPAVSGEAAGGGPATAGPASSDAKLTASDYERRAAALAARREYAAAIADYTRAIELEPGNAQVYRARALARLQNRQPVLAIADLDQALQHKPDDVQTLMLRAELFLQGRDTVRGAADIEAAEKLAPADAQLQSRIGMLYGRAGLYDQALKRLDAWIAAHPRSEDIGQALGARCWVRAMAGKELNIALADCDQALRRDRNSMLMSYRGLVLFRMGRLDEGIKQYGDALKAQPKLALALYGRGLAELKKGDKAQGDADIAAATAIAPGLAQEYRRFGLAPEGAPSPAGPAKTAGG